MKRCNADCCLIFALALSQLVRRSKRTHVTVLHEQTRVKRGTDTPG